MLGIIDYGVGNIGSIRNMVKSLGYQSLLVAQKAQLKSVSKLILPGVGTFDHCLNSLKKNRALLNEISHLVLKKNMPVLGICAGMQIMLEDSEEGVCNGLGWLPGTVKKFDSTELTVPHMGWNNPIFIREHPLTKDISINDRFYFVHSYYVKLKDCRYELMSCGYGHNFTTFFRKQNIFGVQFHPEKSHRFGKKILKNFLEYNYVKT